MTNILIATNIETETKRVRACKFLFEPKFALQQYAHTDIQRGRDRDRDTRQLSHYWKALSWIWYLVCRE